MTSATYEPINRYNDHHADSGNRERTGQNLILSQTALALEITPQIREKGRESLRLTSICSVFPSSRSPKHSLKTDIHFARRYCDYRTLLVEHDVSPGLYAKITGPSTIKNKVIHVWTLYKVQLN